MRVVVGETLAAVVLSVGAMALAAGASAGAADSSARAIAWPDVTTLHVRLEQYGITEASFAARVAQIRERSARRVREGDLDHLVFYLLQSTRFTTLPPIEPALSAKAYVDSGRVPDAVPARVAAFVKTLAASRSPSDARLAFFRDLATSVFPDRRTRRDDLLREYERAMRFLYEKEFVAQRSEPAADAVAELYRKRGLSTDTAVEAGYLVYQGFGVLKSLEPTRPIRRVLIVGPGLDLAPRTGLLEQAPPESYQPWAVIDALLGLGVARADDLEIVAADINPRVVEHLRRARTDPPLLTLMTGLGETVDVQFSDGYREYFAGLGKAIGTVKHDAVWRKRVQVREAVARRLRAERLDVVTERLQEPPFDVIVATNVFPYFDEVELTLAMSNIAAMLGRGGVFLNNDSRPLIGDVAHDLGLRYDGVRQSVIATVRGAKPLADVVHFHRKPE